MRRGVDCGFRVDLYAYKGMRREEGEMEVEVEDEVA